jgi:virulence factor Mce-like protein
VSGSSRLAGTTARRLLGAAFVVVLALLVGLSVAVYDKAFTPVVRVTLVADSVGNQLAPGADVKIRGLIVGAVRAVRSTGAQARVELALNPALVGEIPPNVQARLLPKTLFGARYVSLLVPGGQPRPGHLAAGTTIQQDRSVPAVELEQVLGDVLPLLRAVSPGKVNATLHALSTALQGRGERLGGTIVTANAYLAALDARLPVLLHDIRALADVADTYHAAAPDLLAVLDNLQTTERTVTDQRARLAATLRAGTALARTAEPFLASNTDRLIKVNAYLRPTLAVLAEFAPEYPCFFRAVVADAGKLAAAFGAGTSQPGLHLTVEAVRDRGAYLPDEKPRHNLRGTASCAGLPNPPVPFPVPPFDDGSRGQLGWGSLAGTLGGTVGDILGGTLGRVMSADLGTQGSPAETRLVKGLIAQTTGGSPEKVPDAAAILLAPMARGTEVDLS